MGFQFPNSPALNDTYAPVGGPVFTWDGTAWKGTSQGAPVTVYVSDTAPLSPAIGQLWWNSATATMAIWYADSDSAQWVQVSGQVLPTAPSDNGEYVMVNGVWRLVRQSFSLAGLTTTSTLDVMVPAWNPTQLRCTYSYYVPASTTYLVGRLSVDGTTFAAGASDYYHAGYSHLSAGAGTFSNAPWAGAPGMSMGIGSNVVSVGELGQLDLALTRSTTAQYFTGRILAQGYITGNEGVTINYIVSAIGFTGTPTPSPVKAIRFLTGAGTIVSGKLTVDWLQ